MSWHKVKIKSIEKFAHNVLKIITEKPKKYAFTQGPALDISINKNGWQYEKRPFIFSCCPIALFGVDFKTFLPYREITRHLLELKRKDE